MQLKITDQKALLVAWLSFQVWSKVVTLHVRHWMTSKTEKQKGLESVLHPAIAPADF